MTECLCGVWSSAKVFNSISEESRKREILQLLAASLIFFYMIIVSPQLQDLAVLEAALLKESGTSVKLVLSTTLLNLSNQWLAMENSVKDTSQVREVKSLSQPLFYFLPRLVSRNISLCLTCNSRSFRLAPYVFDQLPAIYTLKFPPLSHQYQGSQLSLSQIGSQLHDLTHSTHNLTLPHTLLT